jgi:DNA-binding NtrC family response regulator
MNPSAQAKVLRVLQEGELERVGGNDTIKVDVRVIAATNKDLQAEIAAGRFREDLYYRLAVVPIELPPLRTRREDVPGLVEHFLEQVCESNDRRTKRVAAGAMTLIMQHDWPGNVRELKNVVERLVILTGDVDVIGESDVMEALPRVKSVKGGFARGTPFKDLVAASEREIILAALEANDHHVSNTARELQLERSHLYKKMRSLGIDHRAETED